MRRAAVLLCAAATFAVTAPGDALAKSRQHVRTPDLAWQTCTADGWECATAAVPKDYRQARGTLELAVTRLPAADPAKRIGSIFVNYGGPGGGAVATTQAVGRILFGAFHDRFDIVAFDPRGTDQSQAAIDCQADQETEGVYSQPYMTPDGDIGAYLDRVDGYLAKCRALNEDILPYVSTANVARDMDLLRKAVGDDKLTYFGFSYGTYLGSTYAALFPDKTRALVLDGALDLDQHANDPMGGLISQTSGFERAYGRLMAACAAHQDFCTFAGGDDPGDAFDTLVDQADASPVPAGGRDPRPVTGQDMLQAVIAGLYAKQAWPGLVQALNEAAAGDATLMRGLVDDAYGRNPDGTYSPGTDRYFTISAVDAYGKYSDAVRDYVKAGYRSWSSFDHFWFNTGYVELNWARFGIRPRGVYDGPFALPADTATPLVVGTTYDPATPYRGAKRAVKELGNARLLTMRGDGHTAYFGNSQCIDDAVNAYVNDLVLPPVGTSCEQDVAFPPAAQAAVTRRARRAAAVHTYQGRGLAPLGRR